jgi:hypothetical protein
MKFYLRKLINSFAARVINRLFEKKITPTERDYKREDFSPSTQKMGVSFTGKVRNYFRRKWLHKTDNNSS